MMQEVVQRIAITAQAGRREIGALRLRCFSKRERLRRALGVWVMAWVAAVPAALIPVAHFVLVPVLLLAGPLLGYRRYRVVHCPLAVEGRCPLCRHHFTLPADARARLPYWDLCPHCGRNVRFARAEEPGSRAAHRAGLATEHRETQR